MSKKKKIIIIICIIVALLVAGLVTWLIIRNNDKDGEDADKPTPVAVEKITITFDADGGEKVEDMVVNKGSSFQLPETTKEGYVFVGWYNGSKLYTDDDTADIEKDTVLTAKWEEIEEEEKVLTVSFDAKGGSKVADKTFKCGKDNAAELKNLPKSKKDSYEFRAWEDKHGKAILDGAKITCEGDKPTLKLYAAWEYDGPTANPENNPETTVVKEKTYKCPSGYELKDTNRCVQFAEKEKYCDSGWKLVGSDCVNPSSPNPKGTRTCPSKTYGGWTGTGTYYEAGRGYCGYEELTSYIGQKTNCQNNGGTLAPNNHCYKHIELGYTVTCASNEKTFAAQEIAPGNGGGCYQVSTPKSKCPAGYTDASVYGGCAKIVDATLE